MNNSSEPAREGSVPAPTGRDAAQELEFPIEPEFMSRPPRLDFETMQRRWEETMPWRNARPGEREKRLAEKIDVEFVL